MRRSTTATRMGPRSGPHEHRSRACGPCSSAPSSAATTSSRPSICPPISTKSRSGSTTATTRTCSATPLLRLIDAETLPLQGACSWLDPSLVVQALLCGRLKLASICADLGAAGFREHAAPGPQDQLPVELLLPCQRQSHRDLAIRCWGAVLEIRSEGHAKVFAHPLPPVAVTPIKALNRSCECIRPEQSPSFGKAHLDLPFNQIPPLSVVGAFIGRRSHEGTGAPGSPLRFGRGAPLGPDGFDRHRGLSVPGLHRPRFAARTRCGR